MDLRDSSRDHASQDVFSSGKGKQPATLGSRIASSTTDMIRDLVGSSSASELAARRSTGLGLGNKMTSASSSTTSSQWAENLPTRTGRSTTQGLPGSSHSSFRSSPIGEYRSHEFDAFNMQRLISPGQEDFHLASHSWTDDVRQGLNDETIMMDVEMADAVQQTANQIDPALHAHLGFRLSDGVKERVEGESKPENMDADQLQHIFSPSSHLDSLPLCRLQMVLGHVIETAQSSSSRLDHSFSQMSLGTLDQHQLATTALHSRYACMEQSSYISDAVSQNMLEQQNQAAKTQQQAQQIHHHEAVRRDSPMADQGTEEELSAPEFHCPWIRCHQCFNNSMEFRDPAKVQGGFGCPHEDCIAQFGTHAEWAEHITEPHHDLQAFNIRSPTSSED